jgi:hypothetical protein
MYRCEATSVEGFVQQLAVGYLARGYSFYVAGSIPAEKEPANIDARIISKYGIAVSKFTRCRRNKEGFASLQYLRFGRFFVILARPGEHRFFTDEPGVRNVRTHPIRFAGYSLSSGKGRDGKWHASVRIEKTEFQFLKARFMSVALTGNYQDLVSRFTACGFVPYAPVRNQFRVLLRAVNGLRKEAGLDLIPISVLPRGRRVVRPFE